MITALVYNLETWNTLYQHTFVQNTSGTSLEQCNAVWRFLRVDSRFGIHCLQKYSDVKIADFLFCSVILFFVKAVPKQINSY